MEQGEISLSEREFSRIKSRVYKVAGISLSDAKRTLVVFDAAAAPPGLPATLEHEGIAVRFSRRKGTADDLIEEMLESIEDPRHLTVVSSDHRVQRAARRCRATPIDSEAWLREIRNRSAGSDASQVEVKRGGVVGNPFPPDYLEQIEQEFNENGG